MASVNLNGYFIGTVLKINKETREVAVFIPKLMANLYSGEAESHKYPTNNGINLDNVNTNISSTVSKSNYIWVKAFDKDEGMPDIGSKVFILFIDSSIHLGMWSKFNTNGDYSVIEEERYPKLHSLKINNRSIDVNKDDDIKIEIPNTYSVSEASDDLKSFKIVENFNFYKNEDLNTAVSNLQKSIKFLSDSYIDTYITTIKNLKLFNTTPTGDLLTHLNEVYEKTKVNGITKITLCDNLLDCNADYVYYNTDLVGLKDTYDLYKDYLTAYNNLSEETKEVITDLSEDIINENITIAFDNSLTATDKNNITNYIEYIKGVFPEKVKIIYEYTKDGLATEYSTNETDGVFINLDQTKSYVTNAAVLGNVLTLANNSIIPLNITGVDRSFAEYKIMGWRDVNNTNIFSGTYLMYKDIYAHPVYSGLYISNDEKAKINILNDLGKTYTLLDSNNKTTETDINTYLNSKTFKQGYYIKLLESGTEVLRLTINYTNDEMHNMMTVMWETIPITITTSDQATMYKDTLETIKTIKTTLGSNFDATKFVYNTQFEAAYALLP